MIVDVAVPFRVPKTFHYLIDEFEQPVEAGSLIEVSFRRKKTHGFVTGFSETTDVPMDKLKSVERVLISEPLFDETMLKFLKWVSQYYCHPLGEVLAAAIPKAGWERSLKKPTDDETLQKRELKLGYLESGLDQIPEPTDAQAAALKAIDAETERPVLLHGVTGSGKTEVYIQALEKIHAEGRGAIILVPEISLTPQLLGRFSSRFPGKLAVLHSDLTPKEKYIEWQRVHRGIANIVIGARSAVFAPVKNLGLIVVDEEQESSFKQEDSLRYHARDVAVVRAKMSGARAILGSATPSVESMANALNGKYALVELKQRVRNQPLPKPQFIDLRDVTQFASKTKDPVLTQPMIDKIRSVVDRGEQVLLYLNRLGYAHFLYCRDCGHTWRCRSCDVSLTYYRKPPHLKCHYCGFRLKPPETCEACSGSNIDAIGVGTEQVEHSLREIFPQARIGRMDRSVVKNRKGLEALLGSIANKELDIVVGTQMITKGHDFPGVSLVGILLADSSLNLPDFRAYERTFQIITQVAGRAGRANLPGEVVIQTLNPDHPVLLAAANHQVKEFYKEELSQREKVGYPPYVRLAMLRFQHKSQPKVQKFAHDVVFEVHRRWPNGPYQLIGPAEAPLSRVKDLYRWQAMVKADSVKHLRQVLQIAQYYFDQSKLGVQMAVDVDPIHLW